MDPNLEVNLTLPMNLFLTKKSLSNTYRLKSEYNYDLNL